MWEQAEYILKQVAAPHFWQHTDRASSSPDLVRLKAGNPALIKVRLAETAKRLFTHFRGEGEREGEGEESSSVRAVIFTLIFSSEKSSTLQGVVTVKCFQFVLWGNCFSPRLTSATCEQLEKSKFCSFKGSYVLFTWGRYFLLSWESTLAVLSQTSQRESQLQEVTLTQMHLVT